MAAPGQADGRQDSDIPDTIDSEFFKPVTIEELSPASRSAMIVQRVIHQGPGYQCGLRNGDRVLAINGRRIYSRWEFDYYRNQFNRDHDLQMDLIINRRGHILPLSVRPLMPLRKLGFYEGDDNRNLDEVLERIGVTIPVGAAASLRRIPVRALYALDDWLNTPTEGPRNHKWLGEFVALRMHLANQDWDKAKASEHEIPIAYFQKLTDFYLSVAARNREDHATPDPTVHNVSLAYYVFHYPFPRFAPPLGSFDASDSRFREWVKLLQADTTRLDPPPGTDDDDEIFQSRSGIHDYLERVKMAIVQPTQMSRWPYRYGGGPLDDNMRSQFIRQLEGMIASHDRDESLYSFALAELYGLDANSRGLISLIKRLRTISPYIAYRTASAAQWAWQFRHGTTKNDELTVLQAYLNEHPIQITAQPSAFYDFIIPRSRHLLTNPDNFVGEPTQSGLIYHPISFASAFGHVDTLDEEAQALDTAIDSPSFAKHRTELLKRLEHLAIPYATPEDLRRLARLGRDDRGRGEILDTFINIVYADFMSNKADTALTNSIADDVMRQVMWPQADQYDRGYAYVHKLISELDDDDLESCRDQLVAAYADHGDVAATCLIAAALDKYGFPELAAEYRGKVDRFAYAVLSRTKPYHDQMAHFNVDVASLCAEGESLDTRRSLYVGVRRYLDYADIPHEAPAYLLAARYELERGKLAKAAKFLSDSFSSAPRENCRPLYLYDGQVTESHDQFRVWLVRKLAAHKDLDESVRQQLADSPLPAKLPDVADELGLSAPAASAK